MDSESLEYLSPSASMKSLPKPPTLTWMTQVRTMYILVIIRQKYTVPSIDSSLLTSQHSFKLFPASIQDRNIGQELNQKR